MASEDLEYNAQVKLTQILAYILAFFVCVSQLFTITQDKLIERHQH